MIILSHDFPYNVDFFGQIQAAKEAEKARRLRNRDGVVQTEFCTIDTPLVDPTKSKTDSLKPAKVIVEVEKGPE